MRIGSTEIVDSFAEAFGMWAARVVITADSEKWALAAARSMTGFATSVIGCKCEAGIEASLSTGETPDGRPGMSVLLFAFDAEGLAQRLVDRVGQSVMTCPTTACFDGLPAERAETRVQVGSKLRYFGDGYQISKRLDRRRYWRIPVMDGEFLVEERFGVMPAVGGGNILILGAERGDTLAAAEAAVEAMEALAGVILPFPGGVVRSGSKVGSRYAAVIASTNDAYCPTLRGFAKESHLPEGVDCVAEIVIDGLDEAAVREAMKRGTEAAAAAGAIQVSAGNYGGNLGKFKFRLHELFGS